MLLFMNILHKALITVLLSGHSDLTRVVTIPKHALMEESSTQREMKACAHIFIFQFNQILNLLYGLFQRENYIQPT